MTLSFDVQITHKLKMEARKRAHDAIPALFEQSRHPVADLHHRTAD
jgi:hypothetical protein